MRYIYTFLLCLLIPVIVVRLFWKGRINPAYRQRILERFAVIPKPTKPIKVWVHAVSVGETIAVKPLIEKLLETYGAGAVLVTTTTPTGSDTVRRLFKGQVLHHYFPYDVPVLVNRYLKVIQPEVVVCMETEIWPNLWYRCHQSNIPMVLANARLSTRSTRRYLKLRSFIANVLNHASLIACRNSQDQKNFITIGADVNRVKVVGDIKSDIALSDDDKQKGHTFRAQWGDSRLVLVAASTHEGEDSLVLDMYQSLKAKVDDLVLVLVPRHPERFSSVGDLIESRGYRLQRRSVENAFLPQTDVILGDSMGEMMAWYASADVVFMGGSLVPTGGHNPLEPLACAVPVISGPHIFNFKTAFDQLITENAAWVADNINAVTTHVLSLLLDGEKRVKAGKKGQTIIEKDKGATQRLVDCIAGYVRGT